MKKVNTASIANNNALATEIPLMTLEEQKYYLDKWQKNARDPNQHPLSLEDTHKINEALMQNQKDTQTLSKIRATHQKTSLVQRNNCEALATQIKNDCQPTNELETLLMEQMAAAHNAGMHLLGGLLEQLNEPGGTPLEQLDKVAHTVTRLMNTYQSGYQTLTSARQKGQQQITVKHQYVQVTNGQAVVADKITLKKSREGVDEKK